tara:strand:+ start:269 stop:544 length:276 start_codon:yes stop_codon:yes gene_type:complete
MAKMRLGSKEIDTDGPFSKKDTEKYLAQKMGQKRDTTITATESDLDWAMDTYAQNLGRARGQGKIGKQTDQKITKNSKTGKYTYSGTFKLK